MAEPLKLTFRQDTHFENTIIDLENILTKVSDALALKLPQSEFPATIITGESSNANGIAAYSAQRLVPGIRLKVQSNDFNYDTGENRITGTNEPYTMQMSVIASADAEPGVIVRRDINGNFAGKQITADSIIMNYPNITVNGTNIFDSDGKLVINVSGTADNSSNVTTSIGNISISDIFVTNVSGAITGTVRNAANVTDTIKGISIIGLNNTDPNTGIFQIGTDPNGSDTYCKRALVAEQANSLVIGGTEVVAGNFARLDANNTFGANFVSTFGNAVATTFTSTNATISRLTFPQTSATSRPTGATFYVGDIEPNGITRLNFNGYLYATRIGNSMYNDVAECFVPVEGLEYSNCIHRILQINNDGKVELADELSTTVIGVTSDNYGYLLGGTEKEIKNNLKIPVGLTGTLWIDLDDDKFVGYINIGEFICSGKNGKARSIEVKNTNDIKYNNTIVGKIIAIDKSSRRVKVLLTLK